MRQREPTRNTMIGPDPGAICEQAAVMERSQYAGTALSHPIIQVVDEGQRNPRVTDGKKRLCLRIVSRLIAELRHHSILSGNLAIDIGVIDEVLVVGSRWPGEDEDVVTLACGRLRRRI